jgi:hypothetical protein
LRTSAYSFMAAAVRARPARRPRNSRSATHAVGAAREDDRDARAEHDAGAVGLGEEAEELRQNVGGLEIGASRMSGSPATSDWIPFTRRPPC